MLLAGSLVTLVPLGLTGHSSAGGSHDLATNSLLIHLVAGQRCGPAGCWRCWPTRCAAGSTPHLAARRFSAVALWCFVAMALSGVINAFVRVRFADLFTTEYGLLVVAKIVALTALGGDRLAATAQRGGRAAADPQARGPLIRLAHDRGAGVRPDVRHRGRASAAPRRHRRSTSIRRSTEVAIGYDFAGPPTVARILFDWRFDLVFGTAAIVFAAVYVAGVIRLRRRGDRWPVGRTVAWLLGCAVLLFTTSSGVGRYMPAMFSMHMAAHMLLSMLTPILLVLGAPVTLALRALPRRARATRPGCANGCSTACTAAGRGSSPTRSWPR